MLTLLVMMGLSNAQESDLIDEAASAFNVPTFSRINLWYKGRICSKLLVLKMVQNL